MVYSMPDAIFDIIDKLEEITCQEKSSKTVWACIISDIKSRDAISAGYVNLIEKEISSFISRISDEDKISIWRESEAAISGPEDTEHHLPVESIEMDLESELLDEITRYAFEGLKN